MLLIDEDPILMIVACQKYWITPPFQNSWIESDHRLMMENEEAVCYETALSVTLFFLTGAFIDSWI